MKSNYYPTNENFTEISIRFLGNRKQVSDVKCYLKLCALNQKLGIRNPEYIVENEFFSYGNYFRYGVRSILDTNKEKKEKITTICSELVKYGVKTNSIPIIELIHYGKETKIYTLENYLKNKNIKLKDLKVEELTQMDEQGVEL